MKALIVDDEEEIGLMVSKILKKEGIQADFVGSAPEALDKIHEVDYSLFFLDLSLKESTGFDLMPMIRKELPDAYMVVISAYNSPDEKNKAFELGARSFIEKPFSKRDILEVVEEISK